MRIVEKTSATVLMVTHDVDEAVLLSDRVVMMTNGPAARIGDILEVTLPRPRNRLALAHDPKFMDLRAAVLEFLYEKQAQKARLKVA
jgi:nitrate/nitrite transport system ATP-binding protein